MTKQLAIILLISLVWAYLLVFQLPYAVWEFALSQNWFTDNGLIMFRDIIYHHTQLPLFLLWVMSRLFGNTPEMLRISSFFLAIAFLWLLYFVAERLAKKGGVTTLIFTLITFPVLFNNFNIEEMTASWFTLASAYTFLSYWERRNSQWLLAAGVAIALGFMGKQVAIGIVPAMFIASVWLLRHERDWQRTLLTGSTTLITGVAAGTLPFIIYYAANGALDEFWYWNFAFNLTVYPKFPMPRPVDESLLYGGWMLVSLLGGLVLFLDKKQPLRLRMSMLFLGLTTVFLAPTVLPSFHVYKLLPVYPYPLLLLALLVRSYQKTIQRVLAVLTVVVFLPAASSFYKDYLPHNLFQPTFIHSYGEQELAVVDWIRQNTTKDERIMNLGNHYITTLAQRLPKNRYVYIFPWLIAPMEESSREILADPPQVVIVDKQVLDDWPTLRSWLFLTTVENSYKEAVSYGTYSIYVAK